MRYPQQLIEKNFPINSQTSNNDKLFFLKTIDFLKSKINEYKYIEIGSFLGGTLVPSLKDDRCNLVISVDERERQQPDERGAKYDYAGITEQTMIDNLLSHSVDISKLKTHNGSINTYNCPDNEFDLAFIDGEHTDVACVRDFAWLYPKMKKDSIILFHDSSIVHRGLSIVRELMFTKKTKFLIAKHESSEMTAIFQGEFAIENLESIYGNFEDWNIFQSRSDLAMLSAVINNRVKFKGDYEIIDVLTYKV